MRDAERRRGAGRLPRAGAAGLYLLRRYHAAKQRKRQAYGEWKALARDLKVARLAATRANHELARVESLILELVGWKTSLGQSKTRCKTGPNWTGLVALDAPSHPPLGHEAPFGGGARSRRCAIVYLLQAAPSLLYAPLPAGRPSGW